MKILDEIIKIYVEINDIYHKLLNLEFNGKLNDKEALELIDLLKSKIVKEKLFFNVLFNNYRSKYDEILSNLSLGNDGFEPYISRRLYDYMNMFDENDIYINSDLSSDEYIIDETRKRLDKLYEFYSASLTLIYFSFMTESIHLDIFSSIKKHLLGLKYYDGLVNHDMEKVLLENNFSFSKINYIDMNMMSLKLGIGPILNDEIKYMVCKDLIRSSVIRILEVNNDDYNDEFIKAGVINAECLLRSCLIFISDNKEIYDKEINEIYKMIQENEKLCHWISEDIIKSIINNINNDKCRVRKISAK